MSAVPVSVVIPTSGRFELLERALNSLLQSTLVPREVIVVADSSLKDPTAYLENLKSKFGSSFEKLSCIQSSRASGAAGTRNAGLSLVSNEFVAFLDDDDEFLPEKLSTQISAMQKSGAVFCFSDYYRVSDSSTTYADCKPKSKYKGSVAREIAFDDCRIATPTVVLRMSFIENLIPLFPEGMDTREDNYAWLKVLTKPGSLFVHLSQGLTKVNLSRDSVQRSGGHTRGNIVVMSREELEILRLANGSGLRTPFLYHPTRLLIRVSVLILSKFFTKK
jgi:glycosyltransferase involved in cell wall biosynthesis